MMNTAQRTFYKQDNSNTNKLSQSFGNISQRNNNKLLSSTGFSNGFGVSYHAGLNGGMGNTSARLPNLSRSASFSCNSKSSKIQLAIFDNSLNTLTSKLHDLRLDTRESRRFCNFLTDDLGQRQLTTHRNNLLDKITKMDKMFKISKKNNEDRTMALQNDCLKLKEFTQSLKEMAALVNCKIDNIQNTMGVYSGKEKHKY